MLRNLAKLKPPLWLLPQPGGHRAVTVTRGGGTASCPLCHRGGDPAVPTHSLRAGKGKRGKLRHGDTQTPEIGEKRKEAPKPACGSHWQPHRAQTAHPATKPTGFGQNQREHFQRKPIHLHTHLLSLLCSRWLIRASPSL